jgi:beta-glucosidase-like glycosyl hydrolase
VLRGQWGFGGFVVSDWTGVLELLAHGIAADSLTAARRALAAGVDMEMSSTLYRVTLAAEVQAGRFRRPRSTRRCTASCARRPRSGCSTIRIAASRRSASGATC